MKFIKSYNLFEARDVSQYISDIFTDLKDDGYEVIVYDTDPNQKAVVPAIHVSGYGNYTNGVTVYINKLIEKDGTLYREDFNTNNIRTYVDWLGRYMKSEGFTNYWVWVEADKNIPVIPRRSDKYYNLVHYDNQSSWDEKRGEWISHGFLRKVFNKIRDRIVDEKILPKNILTDQVKLVFAKDNDIKK